MAPTTEIVSSANTNSLSWRWCHENDGSGNRSATHYWCLALSFSASLCIFLHPGQTKPLSVWHLYVQCPPQVPCYLYFRKISIYVCVCVCMGSQTVHTRDYYHSRSGQFGARALCIPPISTILNSDTLCSSKHTYQLSASAAFCAENTLFKRNKLSHIVLCKTIGNYGQLW